VIPYVRRVAGCPRRGSVHSAQHPGFAPGKRRRMEAVLPATRAARSVASPVEWSAIAPDIEPHSLKNVPVSRSPAADWRWIYSRRLVLTKGITCR
jgi:hypothetical protein